MEKIQKSVQCLRNLFMIWFRKLSKIVKSLYFVRFLNTFKIILVSSLSTFFFLYISKWLQTLRKLASDIQSQNSTIAFRNKINTKAKKIENIRNFFSQSRGRKVIRQIKRCFRRFKCLACKYLQSSANTCETNFQSCSKNLQKFLEIFSKSSATN